MRELTEEELLLVAGGTDSDTTPWWVSAFESLSDGLNAIGNFFGGWMGDYLGGWGDVSEGMIDNGEQLDLYDDYVDSQIEGSYEGTFGDYVDDYGSFQNP